MGFARYPVVVIREFRFHHMGVYRTEPRLSSRVQFMWAWGIGLPEEQMNPAGQYLRRATELLLLSEHQSDPDERKAMRELALCWLRQAEAADHYWQEKSAA
jgi:hypothetical protein